MAKDHNDSSQFERIDTPVTTVCPLNKENNLGTIFAPNILGMNPNGDAIPCISKHLAITNTYVMSGANTEYIIINPNTHSDIMGYRFEKTAAGIRLINTLKSPFNHGKYRLSKMVSAVIYCKSDTQSTTNVALSGVMSSMIMYDLPTEVPEFEELTRMSLLPAYGVYNIPLWTGTRAILPPIPRNFTSGDSAYLSLSEAQEHELLHMFTVGTQSTYTYDGGFYTAASPLWMVIRPTVAGQTGTLRVTKDGDANDYPFGPYGVTTALYVPPAQGTSVLEFYNMEQITSLEIILYSADPLLAPDMDPKLFMAITGTSGPRNIVISGGIRKQLVPTNDMLEITTLRQPYSFDPSIFEAANMLLAGPIPAVAPYGDIPVPTIEEAASLSTGHCSLATFAKTLVGGMRSLGISPANLLRKGISWLSGLANKGVDMAERSGYASQEYELDQPQFEEQELVGYCMDSNLMDFGNYQSEIGGNYQIDEHGNQLAADEEIYQDVEFLDEQEDITPQTEVKPTVVESDIKVTFENPLKGQRMDFPDYEDFARCAIMKQNGKWGRLIDSIGARVPGTSGTGTTYVKLTKAVHTYQPFIALTRVASNNVPFMAFVKLILSPQPPVQAEEKYHPPWKINGTTLYLSRKMDTTMYGAIQFDFIDTAKQKHSAHTNEINLLNLLVGAPEWKNFFVRCIKFKDNPINIIVDFHTGAVNRLVEGSWLGALHACMFGTSPTVCFLNTISNATYFDRNNIPHPLSICDNVNFTWKVYINNPSMRKNYPEWWPTTNVIMAIYCSPRKFASFVASKSSRSYSYGWGYPSPDSKATIFFGTYDFSVVRKFGLYKYVSGFIPEFTLTRNKLEDIYDKTPQDTKDKLVSQHGYTVKSTYDTLTQGEFSDYSIAKINNSPYFKQRIEEAANKLSKRRLRSYKAFWNVLMGIMNDIANDRDITVKEHHRMTTSQKLYSNVQTQPNPARKQRTVLPAMHAKLGGQTTLQQPAPVPEKKQPPPMQTTAAKIPTKFGKFGPREFISQQTQDQQGMSMESTQPTPMVITNPFEAPS